MPEGDIVWWTCRRLHAALAGQRLTGCEFRVPALAATDFTGVGVLEAVSRGKHQLIRFDNGFTLHTHLRMDGAWRFARAGERPRGFGPEHQLRVVLGTVRGSALGYRLPVVEIVPTAEEDEVVGFLGPDLLGPDWDPERATANLRREPARSIGEALLDQRNLAGIGTFWRAELCFLQGIHPRTPVAELDDTRMRRLLTRAHTMLDANRDGRQTTTGDRRADKRAWVFERHRQPCRRCGTAIDFEEFGPLGQERTSYWCPHCQPSSPAPG